MTTLLRSAAQLEVHGTVQGVGFRPFVYRLAHELGLDGTVRNAGGAVLIEAAGPPEAMDALAARLRVQAPPRAKVTQVRVRPLERGGPAVGTGFTVVDSSTSLRSSRDFPPDLATCDECLRELFDPADRRYRYPFVNCTNCGPRATIIDDLPYDRVRTVMRQFPLCPACAGEYRDPLDRRFHAEPVACPSCGPQLAWQVDPRPGRYPVAYAEEALQAAVAAVGAGLVVALKGLGGYQLVVDATNPDAVARLRRRKRRWAKPFAVMVGDLAAAQGVAIVTATEASMLTSTARPIVLVHARQHGSPMLAPEVHPGLRQIGLFLPNTPLHHLLLHDLDRPLVVTSGNRSDEPILIDDTEALAQLDEVADGFLLHDRPIRARYDDSVTRAVGRHGAPVRRARGYVPGPLRLPVRARRPVLAVGAELKSTFTLAMGSRALVGPHLGDLEDAETMDAFEQTLTHLTRLESMVPEVVAHDLHPGYLSTQFALREFPDAADRVAVQHHHAHVAACAAEFGVVTPYIGVAYDGLGLGDDGTLWGGEVLIADLAGYRRFARFSRAPLPGGAVAVRRPARMALGYLYGAEPLDGPGVDDRLVAGFAERFENHELSLVRTMVERGLNSPQASSAGRLFDAASSLLGVRDDAAYEGEAAMMLEALVDEGERGELAWRLVDADGLLVYDVRPTLAALLSEVAAGTAVEVLAGRFHRTVAAVTIEICRQARKRTGLGTVCLGGGVFQNRRLVGDVVHGLRTAGFDVHIGREVPVNDGGISYGQAAVAAARGAG